jgi:hypothetical protein
MHWDLSRYPPLGITESLDNQKMVGKLRTRFLDTGILIFSRTLLSGVLRGVYTWSHSLIMETGRNWFFLGVHFLN